ncbi:MAG: type II toxin-antitoxin system Phd/YefM family antitoxin [Solirubrobacteraceae bacterium]
MSAESTSKVGIRALKQNASAVVRMAAGGEVVTITEHGREVAQMTAMPSSALDRLEAAGRLRRASRPLLDVIDPKPVSGREPSAALQQLREDRL